MWDFEMIQSLIGEDVTEDELKYVDCYLHKEIGLFIPANGDCKYAQEPLHKHPSYMVIISFLNPVCDLE